jgi:hypothetical protein
MPTYPHYAWFRGASDRSGARGAHLAAGRVSWDAAPCLILSALQGIKEVSKGDGGAHRTLAPKPFAPFPLQLSASKPTP